mgnify:CR=1|jgi:hypothetical protein
MKKLNKNYFQQNYLMSYKSIAWWEDEINEYVDFFERNEKNGKYSKRIVDKNKEAYGALVGRGNVEAQILDEIEIEFQKYNAKKKKK